MQEEPKDIKYIGDIISLKEYTETLVKSLDEKVDLIFKLHQMAHHNTTYFLGSISALYLCSNAIIALLRELVKLASNAH